MALVRTSLTLGQVKAQGKTVNLSKKRASAFVDKFRAQKADGIKIGVPWSHFEECAPDAKHFLETRFNAGYVDDMSLSDDGKKINFVLDCPGLVQEDGKLVSLAKLEDGTTVKTAISEVSPGIWSEWIDGKGRVHKDTIGHVALCVRPVVADQTGFTALSAKNTSKITYLSASMPELEELKDDVEEASAPEEAEPDVDSILQPETPVADEQMTRILSNMQKGGMPLPPDTTKENFFDRFETALGILLERMNAAKTAESIEPEQEAPLVEEQGPAGTMLSTLRARIDSDPLVRALITERNQDKKAKRAALCDSLAKRGVPIAEIDKLRSAKVFLSSFNQRTGTFSEDETDKILALLDRIIPQDGFERLYLSAVTPQSTEISDSTDQVKVGNVWMSKEQAADVLERSSRVA